MPVEKFDMVCLGGGVAAGYWAEEVAALGKAGHWDRSTRPKICIISGYPDGLVPYERSELSKDSLRPSNSHSRDWQAWGNKTFPYTSIGNDRDARNARWYRDNGVTILAWCECYEVNTSTATLEILQYSDRIRTRPKAKQLTIAYGSLLVATGSSPKRLDGDRQSPCYCVRHPDLRGARIDRQETYGLGSSHYLRDIGDCIKLVKALGTAPAGAGTGDVNTVVLVGGGFLNMEVAASIATHYRGVRTIMLVAGPRLMPELFSQEMSDFYEEKLTEAGVLVEKNVTTERLWGLEEQGEFETVGGERVHFGPAPRGYTECRGVVIRGDADQLVHVPARVVLIGIGATPNSELLVGQLDTTEDGGVCVDVRCRATHLSPSEEGGKGGGPTSRPVYAVGDVAAYPLPLESGRLVRHEHIQNARDMAIVAARNMVEDHTGKDLSNGEVEMNEDAGKYQPVPGFSSKFLGLSWRFYGVAEGEIVVLGIPEFRTTRTFGAFWVRKEKVVGAFLEGGTVEQRIAVAQVTRLRPKVFSPKLLQDSQLGDFLEDPGSIEASDDSDLAQLLMCCRCV